MHHIPNIISILRIILVLPIAILLHKEAWLSAFILIFIAGISDAIDGFLARAFRWQSHLGSILDPLADKLLLIVLFVSLASKGIIPVWLAALVVGRDVIILIGAIIFQWLTRDLKMSPLFSSKVNTALQIIFVLAVMYHLAVSQLSDSLIYTLQISVALTTLFSGFLYVIYWTRYTMDFFQNKSADKTVASNMENNNK